NGKHLTMQNTIVRRNTATKPDSSFGGGVMVDADNSDITFRNCLFHENVAHSSGGGGGLSCRFFPPSALPSNLPVQGCTFAENSVLGPLGGGGGILIGRTPESLGESVLRDCLLWNNTATSGGQLSLGLGTCTVSFSDLQGGLGGVQVIPGSNLVWGSGNI